MPTYLTGRTRTIVWSGAIDGSIHYRWGAPTAQQGFVLNDATFSVFTHQTFGIGPLGSVGGQGNGGVISNDDPPHWQPYYEVTAVCLGQRATQRVQQDYTNTSQRIDWAPALNGSYSMSFDVEECVTFGTLDEDSMDDDGWPKYGGAAYPGEDLRGTSVKFWERLRVGGTATVTVTACGVTATSTVIIGVATPINSYSLEHWHTVNNANQGRIGYGAASTLAITNRFHNRLFGAAYTWSSGAFSADVSQGMTMSIPSASDTGHNARCEMYLSPLTEYALDARLRCMEDAYNGSQVLQWSDHAEYDGTAWVQTYTPVTLNPNGTATVDQAEYYTRLWFDDVAQASYNLHQVCGVRCRLTSAGLDATKDDTRGWRVLEVGALFDAMTISHAAQTVLDDCSSTSGWTAGANSTIGQGTGTVTVSANGGAGSATRSFSPAKVGEAYRYLRLRLSCSAAATIAVAIGSKTWTVDVGTSAADHDVDLCIPGNATAKADGKTSRYPLDASGFVQDSVYWGVSLIGGITLSGVPDGQSLTVDDISLVRLDHAKLTALPEFDTWENVGTYEDGDDEYWQQRSLSGDVDGRLSLDLYDVLKKKAASDGVISYTVRTIKDAIAAINAITGYTATAGGALTDTDGADYTHWRTGGYLNNNRPLLWLMGAGAWYASATDGWKSGVSYDITSGTKTIVAATLQDECFGYPGIGDAWLGADYPGPNDDWDLPVRVTAHKRGRAWGLLKPTGTVELTDNAYSAATPGSGQPNTIYEYQTGQDYERGNHSHRAFVRGSTTALSHLAQDRRITRACFILPQEGSGNVSYDVSDSQIHVLAWIQGGEVHIGLGNNEPAPIAFSDISTGIAAEWVCVRWERKSSAQRLLLWVEDQQTIKQYTSTTGGLTWGMATTISASGKHPVAAVERGTLRYIYWTDSGAIMGQVRDAQDQVVVGTFTAVASGADDAGIDAKDSVGMLGAWRVCLFYGAGGAPTQAVSTDGRTFS